MKRTPPVTKRKMKAAALNRPTLEDLELENEAPLLLRSLQSYLREAFVTSNCGGGKDPHISVQFRTLKEAHGFHDILVSLMKNAENRR